MEEHQVSTDRRPHLRVAVGCRFDCARPGAGFAKGDGPGRVVAQDALFGRLFDVTGLGVFKESTEGFDAKPQRGSGFGAYEQLVGRNDGAEGCAGNCCTGGDEWCRAESGAGAGGSGEAADDEPDDEGGDISDGASNGAPHANWSTSGLWSRLTGQADVDTETGGGAAGAAEVGEKGLLMREES